jgi:hypothetical protein
MAVALPNDLSTVYIVAFVTMESTVVLFFFKQEVSASKLKIKIQRFIMWFFDTLI